MSLSTTSTLPLNTPRDGGSTTSLGSLFQYLTALSEKKFFLTKHPLASRPSSLSCRGLFGNDGNKRSCLLVLEQILSQFAHLKCSHVAVEEAPRACSTRLVGLCTLCQLPFLRKGGHWLSGLSVYFWWNPAPISNHKNTLKPSEEIPPEYLWAHSAFMHIFLMSHCHWALLFSIRRLWIYRWFLLSRAAWGRKKKPWWHEMEMVPTSPQPSPCHNHSLHRTTAHNTYFYYLRKRSISQRAQGKAVRSHFPLLSFRKKKF